MGNPENKRSVRLMDRPEDFARLGVDPAKTEIWEDGRRETNASGHWEWWYFDAMLDDGTTIVIQFLQKTLADIDKDTGNPSINFRITLPDGSHHNEQPFFKEDECEWSTDRCEVKFGDSTFSGDLETYHINVAPVNGMAASLQLKTLSSPLRPGSAYFAFNEDDRYYTWLCAVPRGEVTGTLTIAGKTREVRGSGYHDHQWGSASHFTLWNHWTWARQSFDDYTLVLFDMVSTGTYGFERFPLVFIEDKDGKIIFSNTREVEYEVLDDYVDKESGKRYPAASRYRFESNGKQVEYTLTAEKVLESRYAYGDFPEPVRQQFDTLGLKPSYSRYSGKGDLVITESDKKITLSGKLVYEFMFPGTSYKKGLA